MKTLRDRKCTQNECIEAFDSKQMMYLFIFDCNKNECKKMLAFIARLLGLHFRKITSIHLAGIRRKKKKKSFLIFYPTPEDFFPQNLDWTGGNMRKYAKMCGNMRTAYFSDFVNDVEIFLKSKTVRQIRGYMRKYAIMRTYAEMCGNLRTA